MGQYRQYTDDFKAGALALLAASGWPEDENGLARTAKHLNVPVSTLRNWYSRDKQPPAELREEKNLELTEAIRRELGAILTEMAGKREDASFKDLAVGFGILAEKLQLLNGEPTQNLKNSIEFTRQGLSSLPQHLAPGAAASGDGAATV